MMDSRCYGKLFCHSCKFSFLLNSTTIAFHRACGLFPWQHLRCVSCNVRWRTQSVLLSVLPETTLEAVQGVEACFLGRFQTVSFEFQADDGLTLGLDSHQRQ